MQPCNNAAVCNGNVKQHSCVHAHCSIASFAWCCLQEQPSHAQDIAPALLKCMTCLQPGVSALHLCHHAASAELDAAAPMLLALRCITSWPRQPYRQLKQYKHSNSIDGAAHLNVQDSNRSRTSLLVIRGTCPNPGTLEVSSSACSLSTRMIVATNRVIELLSSPAYEHLLRSRRSPEHREQWLVSRHRRAQQSYCHR
jgi:hypothetical protein